MHHSRFFILTLSWMFLYFLSWLLYIFLIVHYFTGSALYVVSISIFFSVVSWKFRCSGKFLPLPAACSNCLLSLQQTSISWDLSVRTVLIGRALELLASVLPCAPVKSVLWSIQGSLRATQYNLSKLGCGIASAADPGSGAFLTPWSRILNKSSADPGTRIQNIVSERLLRSFWKNIL